MNIIVPFKIAPLAPAFNYTQEEMLCGDKKSCCKKTARLKNDCILFDKPMIVSHLLHLILFFLLRYQKLLRRFP